MAEFREIPERQASEIRRLRAALTAVPTPGNNALLGAALARLLPRYTHRFVTLGEGFQEELFYRLTHDVNISSDAVVMDRLLLASLFVNEIAKYPQFRVALDQARTMVLQLYRSSALATPAPSTLGRPSTLTGPRSVADPWNRLADTLASGNRSRPSVWPAPRWTAAAAARYVDDDDVSPLGPDVHGKERDAPRSAIRDWIDLDGSLEAPCSERSGET
jgi:hypothetical protein